MTEKYQFRYLVYCRKNGNNTPEEQLKIDENKYPGGLMCGFILWIREKINEFYKLRPDCFIDRHTLTNHKEFDTFLSRL